MLEKVRVFGPASLSNMGPGFDTIGLCLEGIGDVVEARIAEVDGVRIFLDECGTQAGIPTEPAKNTAGVAALEVLNLLNSSAGIDLYIKKGFVAGSGIGSSAACAAASAWAVNLLHGRPLKKDALIEAVLEGEAVASGAKHGDNALPAFLGGLVLVSSFDPTVYRRIPVTSPLWISLILPEIQVLTKKARAMLPGSVPLKTAVHQASALGFMIDALRSGDMAEVGKWIMKDHLAEPVRADLVPCYNSVKNAALDEGAFGCALTGSGPAMFAITDNEMQAHSILQSMIEASTLQKINANGYVTTLNESGTAELSSDVNILSI